MQIRWTIGASKNLEQIEKYVAEDNPAAAYRLIFKVIRAVETLMLHPNLGRPGRVNGTRELVVNGTPYIVPYRIKGDFIEVLRVFHGAMKWPKQF